MSQPGLFAAEDEATFDHERPALIWSKLATFSACGAYRYSLRRVVAQPADGRTSRVVFLLLNPSTADASTDDRTVRKLIGYARAWGHQELLVVNAYGFRATDPRDMLATNAPIGPLNDLAIDAAVSAADLVVCGWGKHATATRVIQLRDLVSRAIRSPSRLTALAVNMDGSPQHPLYLAGDLTPRRYEIEVPRG